MGYRDLICTISINDSKHIDKALAKWVYLTLVKLGESNF